MKPTPIPRELLDATIRSLGIADLSRATIREIKSVAAKAEADSGVEFIKMEMGVPGLPPSTLGVEAEIEALRAGVAGIYPDMEGLPELKRQTSRFVEAFVGINVALSGCIPVVGSMQGTFAAFQLCGQCDRGKDTILFIDPGFNVQKIQVAVQGLKSETFDVYDYRGEKLRGKLESYLEKGNIAALIYSNPNNPSWICLKEEELEIIGELCRKYDVIPIEDLAYFAMDFRTELGHPFQEPYQPTVARWCDNYILLISGSKVFSYAGQRIGLHLGHSFQAEVPCPRRAVRGRNVRDDVHPPYPVCPERWGQPFGTVCAGGDVRGGGGRTVRLFGRGEGVWPQGRAIEGDIPSPRVPSGL